MSTITGTGMDLVCIAKISSRIKGHHVYDYKYTINEKLTCVPGSTNKYSSNAIVVKPKGEENVKRIKVEKEKKKKKKKSRAEIVGHVPEALAQVLYTLISTGKINVMKATVTRMHMDAPEGKWVPGGGVEIPCTNCVYGAKIRKKLIRELIIF